jgi:hypothetical protein
MVIDTSSTEGEIVYKPPAERRDSIRRAFLARPSFSGRACIGTLS